MLKAALLGLMVLSVGLMAVPAHAELASPYQQFKMGIPIQDIQCHHDKILMESQSGKPVCVSSETSIVFADRGYVLVETSGEEKMMDHEDTSMTEEEMMMTEEEKMAMEKEEMMMTEEEKMAMTEEEEMTGEETPITEEEVTITEEEEMAMTEEEKMAMEKEEMEMTEGASGSTDMMTGESTNMIAIPQGTGIPGCEESNECYMPYDVTVNVGDTITWTNNDVTIHTVTAGDDPTNREMIGDKYPNGFDSGLFATDATFEHTFENEGTYPYYCIVHHWMKGTVTVTVP